MGGLGKVHGIASVKKVKHIPKCNVECIEIKGESVSRLSSCIYA
jgi:hypothetical protein